MRTHQEENGAGKQPVSFGNFDKIADLSPFVKTIFAKSAIVLVANSKSLSVKSPLVKSCEHQPHCDWDAE